MTISTRQRIRRRYLKLPTVWRFIIIWSMRTPVIAVGEYALLFFLSALTSAQLLNLPTFVSFGAVEVLALALAKLFGIGEESEEQKTYRKLQIYHITSKLALEHARLEIMFPRDEPEPFYPEYPYYVVNIDTKTAYWVPEHIYAMFRAHVIHGVEFRNMQALRRFARKHGIKIMNRYPWEDELKSIKLRKKTRSRKSVEKKAGV